MVVVGRVLPGHTSSAPGIAWTSLYFNPLICNKSLLKSSVILEARAMGAAYREAARGGIRDFIATEFPASADDLAALVTIALAGMSSAARDGAGAAMLRAFAEAAGRAFRREAESA